MPGQHADEAARGRVYREIARVDLVDRCEMRSIGAIDVALEDLLKRRAGGREAELNLLQLDFGLTLDGKPLDLAGLGVVGRDVRDEHQIAAAHTWRDGNLARLVPARQRFDANNLLQHDLLMANVLWSCTAMSQR